MERTSQRGNAPEHERAWRLLPWYVNDSLDEQERDLITHHLGSCLTCNRELQRLRQLERAVAVAAGDHASAQAYARLSRRLHRGDRGRQKTGLVARMSIALRELFEPVPLIAGAGFLIISALLVATIVVNGDRAVIRSEQPFQTLAVQPDGSGTVRNPLVRAVLHGEPGDQRLAAWLDRHQAELIDGPSEIGVMTVRVNLGRLSFVEVIAAMQADGDTAFVQPVTNVGTRPDRAR